MVGGSRADAPALAAFAVALARRIAGETGLDVRAHGPEGVNPEPGCEVLVRAGLPDPAMPGVAVDLVLLLEGDGSPDTGLCWRDTLITAGLPWARVDWADGSQAVAGAAGGAAHSPERASGGGFDAALTCAIDAATPLLRRRARPGAGLFTRLARRDAEHAGWRWACESCDDPDCEHALRVAARMDAAAALG